MTDNTPTKSDAGKYVIGCVGCGVLLFVGLILLGIVSAVMIPAFVQYSERAQMAYPDEDSP